MNTAPLPYLTPMLSHSPFTKDVNYVTFAVSVESAVITGIKYFDSNTALYKTVTISVVVWNLSGL